MKIKIAGSSVDGSSIHYSATYLIDEQLAIDAGSLGLMAINSQKMVNSVLLSHSHLDHLASLPLFLDNVYSPEAACPQIYAHPEVIDVLQTHFFNEKIWPDIIRLGQEESAFVQYHKLMDQRTVNIDQYQITPVLLHHLVPTFGFIVDDGAVAVAIVTDTSPTNRVWELAKEHPRLKGVILEAAFPNRMRWLAEKAMHLTPEMFLKEYVKLGRDLPVVATHLKPAFHDEIVRELHQLPLSSLSVGTPGLEYCF